MVEGGGGLAAVDDLQVVQLDQVGTVGALVEYHGGGCGGDAVVVGEEPVRGVSRTVSMMPLLTLPRSWRNERTLRCSSFAPYRSYMSASSWPGRTVNTHWWSVSRAGGGQAAQGPAQGVQVDGDRFFQAPGGGEPAEPFDVPEVLLDGKAVEAFLGEAG